MDFDADGHLDLVSGSYDPGELYLFRGQGEGKFAAREVLIDKRGKPIRKVPDQKDEVESFGSWMSLVDWDADGDLDILVGTFEGRMFLRRNEGSRSQPAYAAENEWVLVGTKQLRVPGGAHANPVIADWDGDDRWDILTGSGDGGVYWYRNQGSATTPQFEPPVTLVSPHEGIGYSELLLPNEVPKPGIRSQIAVVDHDGDGKFDVLLGDFCTHLHVRKDLSEDQTKELLRIKSDHDSTVTILRKGMDDLQARYKAMMKGIPESEWHTPENSAKWQKLYKEFQATPERTKTMADYQSLEKQMKPFVASNTTRDSTDTPHGYVWLFRHK